MLISLVTGFIAGAIHVVGGADHLVAMAPGGFRRPSSALKQGIAWGVGHSAGVLILAGIAVIAKDLINIDHLSSLAELAVGVVLLFVGVYAIRTAFNVNIHKHDHIHGGSSNHNHVHFHLFGKKYHGRHSHAATGLGVLHGLAGASHLIAVIPALALPPLEAIAYMGSYLLGSIMAMGIVLLLISLATIKSSKQISKIIMGCTGGLSVAIGFFWIQKTSAQFL